MSMVKQICDIIGGIFAWGLIGIVGTLGVWKEMSFINETHVPVPLTRNMIIVGTLAGPLSAIGAIITLVPTLVYTIITYDSCVAECK